MRKQLILVLSFSAFVIHACVEVDPMAAYHLEPTYENDLPLAITSIDPVSAECGTEITLYGENFGTSVSENFVTFDSWGSEAHSGRMAEVTKVLHSGVVKVRIPMNLVPGDYIISLQAKGNTHRFENFFKITGNL